MQVGVSQQEDVRRYYAAWSRNDVEAMLDIAHPDIEASPTLGLLYERSVYRGHEGIRQWADEVAAAWDGFTPEVLDTLEYDGQVVALIRLIARRHEHEFDATFCVFHRFEDGLILTLRGRDWFEAHEEMGLEPPPL